MAAKLDIRELPDRLEYRVTQMHTRTHLLLRALAWAICLVISLAFVRRDPLAAIIFAGIGLYGGYTDLSGARRGTDVTLTITDRDIISDGYTEKEYHPINRWRTQAPDLSWQESHSFDEGGPTFPQGVYCGSDCVLPLVAMEEGHRIVTAVYARFPDTARDSRQDDSAMPSPIITLGLSK